MSAKAQKVRPHVYEDGEGNEWRCVNGAMQCRPCERGCDEDTDEELPDEFGGHADGLTNDRWRVWLRKDYRNSIPAFDAALDDPMDEDDAAEDDVLIIEARERAAQPNAPVGADRY